MSFVVNFEGVVTPLNYSIESLNSNKVTLRLMFSDPTLISTSAIVIFPH